MIQLLCYDKSIKSERIKSNNRETLAKTYYMTQPFRQSRIEILNSLKL